MVASSIGHIFVLLLNVLARLHELGHFVAVEDLLLVLGEAPLGVFGGGPARTVVHFVLHLFLDGTVAGLAFGAGVHLAEFLEEVVVAAEVLEEVLVLRTLDFA